MIMQHKLGSAFFHQAVPEIFLLHEFGVELDTIFSGKAVIPLKAEKTFHGSQFHVGGAKPFLFLSRQTVQIQTFFSTEWRWQAVGQVFFLKVRDIEGAAVVMNKGGKGAGKGGKGG